MNIYNLDDFFMWSGCDVVICYYANATGNRILCILYIDYLEKNEIRWHFTTDGDWINIPESSNNTLRAAHSVEVEPRFQQCRCQMAWLGSCTVYQLWGAVVCCEVVMLLFGAGGARFLS
jgi:hypothetical protein